MKATGTAARAASPSSTRTARWPSTPGNRARRQRRREFGHYPDFRNKKGVEPEALEVATFGGSQYIFIAEERASLVADLQGYRRGARIACSRWPSGIGPEGADGHSGAQPVRRRPMRIDLREDGGVGSHVMVYELSRRRGHLSARWCRNSVKTGTPSAGPPISGAVADPAKPGRLYAVSDSVLDGRAGDLWDRRNRQSRPKSSRRRSSPAMALRRKSSTSRASRSTARAGFWLASEGDTAALTPHALFHVNADGEIEEEIGYPAALLAGEIRSGSEGIALIGGNALDRDPAGVEGRREGQAEARVVHARE